MRLKIWKLNVPLDVAKVSILGIISAKKVASIKDSILHWFQWWRCFSRFNWNYFSLQTVFSLDATWLHPLPLFPGRCSINAASPPQCPNPIHLPSAFFSFSFWLPLISLWRWNCAKVIFSKIEPRYNTLYQEELPNLQFYYMTEQVPRSNSKRPTK